MSSGGSAGLPAAAVWAGPSRGLQDTVCTVDWQRHDAGPSLSCMLASCRARVRRPCRRLMQWGPGAVARAPWASVARTQLFLHTWSRCSPSFQPRSELDLHLQSPQGAAHAPVQRALWPVSSSRCSPHLPLSPQPGVPGPPVFRSQIPGHWRVWLHFLLQTLWSHRDFPLGGFLLLELTRRQWQLTSAARGGHHGQSHCHHQVGPGGSHVHQGGVTRPELQTSVDECNQLRSAGDGPGRGEELEGTEGRGTTRLSPGRHSVPLTDAAPRPGARRFQRRLRLILSKTEHRQ